MPDRKESVTQAQIEAELSGEYRPVYLIALNAFLKLFFFCYDALVYIPFNIFANPKKKLERSNRIKAVKVRETGRTAVWRHVDTVEGELSTEMFRGCDTLGKLWDEAARVNSENDCMGTREVLESHMEPQPNGRKFQKLVLGEYHWLFRTRLHTAIFEGGIEFCLSKMGLFNLPPIKCRGVEFTLIQSTDSYQFWVDYAEVDESIDEVASALITIGLKKGQHVVIYAETRMEWMVSAIACFKCGFPVITIYPTLGEESIKHALEECNAVCLFTTVILLEKLSNALENVHDLKDVIYFPDLHPDPNAGSGSASPEMEKAFSRMGRRIYAFESFLQVGNAEVAWKVAPTDLAMIMYTSGTTAAPKGVMLSHQNIIAAISGQSKVIQVDTSDTYIGYLPLAHILEVCAELVLLAKGCRIGYSSAQTLFDRAPKIKKGSKGDCGELKPSLIACVPAIMDRIFKSVVDKLKDESPLQRELFRICYERKQSRYEEGYTSLVMNRLAFDKIRKALGGELRFILSGGAPLNSETQRFMNICFCCPVVQGYGLTETCGGASLADVGPPLRSCEIMLREWKDGGYSPKNRVPQGEILIHGGNVAIGYYKNEEKTREDFIELEGKRWFASGDIGEFRTDGSLCVIDRKKDLIKLGDGEYISLGRIETTLLTNEYIDNICVYGDCEHDYLLALVVPNKKNLEALADRIGVAKSWEKLCQDKGVRRALLSELQEFSKEKLNRREMPQKLHICAEVWDSDSADKPGMLTETKKLKRKNIAQTYEKQITQLFNEK